MTDPNTANTNPNQDNGSRLYVSNQSTLYNRRSLEYLGSLAASEIIDLQAEALASSSSSHQSESANFSYQYQQPSFNQFLIPPPYFYNMQYQQQWQMQQEAQVQNFNNLYSRPPPPIYYNNPIPPVVAAYQISSSENANRNSISHLDPRFYGQAVASTSFANQRQESYQSPLNLAYRRKRSNWTHDQNDSVSTAPKPQINQCERKSISFNDFSAFHKSLSNSDDTSIKLLADACLISAQREKEHISKLENEASMECAGTSHSKNCMETLQPIDTKSTDQVLHSANETLDPFFEDEFKTEESVSILKDLEPTPPSSIASSPIVVKNEFGSNLAFYDDCCVESSILGDKEEKMNEKDEKMDEHSMEKYQNSNDELSKTVKVLKLDPLASFINLAFQNNSKTDFQSELIAERKAQKTKSQQSHLKEKLKRLYNQKRKPFSSRVKIVTFRQTEPSFVEAERKFTVKYVEMKSPKPGPESDSIGFTDFTVQSKKQDFLIESSVYFEKLPEPKEEEAKDEAAFEQEAIKPDPICPGKLQAHSCQNLPNISPCIDCADHQITTSDYCRFMDFRKLHRNKENGLLECQGFVEYSFLEKKRLENGKESRLVPQHSNFLPHAKKSASFFDGKGRSDSPTIEKQKFYRSVVNPACYTLAHLANQFKKLLDKEDRFLADCQKWKCGVENEESPIAWRDSSNARELCDVCSTTIFNLHLTCQYCAFVTCIDCFYSRLREERRGELPKENQDDFCWRFCTLVLNQDDQKRQSHGPQNFIMSHLIPNCGDHILSTLQHLNEAVDVEVERYGIKLDDPKSWKTFSRKLPPKDPKSDPNQANPNLPPCHYMFDRDLLVLTQPRHPQNVCLFQYHWKMARPIIVQKVTQDIDPFLWRPCNLEQKCASRSTEGTIVDCRMGVILDNFELSQFWAGFTDCHRRAQDALGRCFILKLKDWPSGAKFGELLPEHYDGFCNIMPIQQYTHPDTGKYNLATNLPSFYIKPDLGPKMYLAYEMIFEPMKATTNLHLDISDAVNVMMHVATPLNINPHYLYSAILKHLETEGLDKADLDRAKKSPNRIGALWTIFKPEDSDTIRLFLNDCADELRCDSPTHDPIHDQMTFLHSDLRRRLEEERGVKGYTFVQMLGDAIFIPAGAAHQVQNMLCCVKVAEDFVSPEGISRCATVAGEFRNLTTAHTNHEDKLQLPNIILHSIIESISILQGNEPIVKKET